MKLSTSLNAHTVLFSLFSCICALDFLLVPSRDLSNSRLKNLSFFHWLTEKISMLCISVLSLPIFILLHCTVC